MFSIYYCNFNSLYVNNQWCWSSFHVLICLLYVFFGEVSVQIFYSFWIGLFSYYRVFKNQLYWNLTDLNKYNKWHSVQFNNFGHMYTSVKSSPVSLLCSVPINKLLGNLIKILNSLLRKTHLYIPKICLHFQEDPDPSIFLLSL